MSYIVPKKMPLRCFECEYISPSTMDGYSCKTAHKSLVSEHGINISTPDWCPLVEIHTPHGDLVDRTELLAEYDRQHKGPAGGARRIMEQATAIIKAEE